MLRVVSHKSAAAARKYYSEGLLREDYYSEKQEVVGEWHGKAARLMGLTGDVTPDAFAALVENRHPGTGERLTARTNSGRVVGYDLNFHAPKSLSILHALTGDETIVKVFRESVAETMDDIENRTATRVRQKGAQANRVTGNFAWAEFVHFTARPVGGIPDPHLHVHCFTFNATHDFVEGRWKAANFRDIKADAPYAEAAFHARLTGKLAALGYGIERTPKGWEISGIPRSVIDKFSQRTALIEKRAEALGITDAKGKDALGAASREGKRHGMTHSDLLAAWDVRLTPDEKAMIFKAGDREGKVREKITPAMALDEACEKLFAKNAVVSTRRLVAEALHFGVGQVSPEQAWREFEKRGMVVREIRGEQLCTSVKVLAEEIALINTVRSGRGMFAPLKGGAIRFADERLSAEQRAAVKHILHSRDQVIGIRGGAGVGKTTAMSEAVAQIEATGRKVFAFAPSAAASRGTLREAGFANAQTLAHLFSNPKLQAQTRGQVIWVDEAGLVGSRDMWKLLQIAGDSTCVIITGDTKQHAPVSRGDPFRLLQQYAGLKVAELTEIRRQQGETYRSAVDALSKGDLRTAFRRLGDLDAIVEVTDDGERYKLLAEEYLSLSRKGHVPLVVSPTHAEGAKVTEAIREAKRQSGQLGPEKAFIRFHDLRWEEPDRRRPENYREGLVVQFNQNLSGGIIRGQVYRVTGRDDKGGVLIENGKHRLSLPLKAAEHFQVYEERQIEVARGDRIRITRNGESNDGRRLNNGDVFTITGFSKTGKIILHTGAVLDAGHGHFTLGYCQTSYTSQSKSIRDVLVAQNADSFLASSREQFYVTVSRGKETIRIYTDSRRELEAAVGISSARKSGVELAGFTKKEVGALVSDESTSNKWRNHVRKGQAEKASQSHAERLMRARKMDGSVKPESMDFRQFLAMKAALACADGRSRSKGHPNFARKGGNTQSQGKSFARPTQLSLTTREKIAAANDNKGRQAKPAAMHPRRERLMKNFEAAKARLGKLVEKVKGKVAAIRDKALPKSNSGQLAKNAERRQSKPDATKTKTQTKAAQKPVAPTPPGPRRGR